ncbi:LOW QUALITY PROTEIN: hypothetical protein T265_13641 [Opisthorchis viverrini]|uniref:Uncharacterized protein n=1 Tax=Opisthorchis viverrini TaxID=6198 RepID=A0A074ZM36_OPIVI|nr:LOW QUALITY PROTEIN: hypothetical protein T265_13641 [Opisthorchis viverrini]KER28116.1 LOW QUALITY PROTEIN: hypothetical protein T265_13641 [Opisthorchis viverrini]
MLPILRAIRVRWAKWLEREFTDRKVRGSNPTSATRLPLSKLGQLGSITALVLPSGGMAARHRKVFDHRCLRSIVRIWWEHWISNSEVRRAVFGRNNSPSIDELITLHRLRWIGHILCMPVERLPRRALFAQPCEGWKRTRGGQTITWQ